MLKALLRWLRGAVHASRFVRPKSTDEATGSCEGLLGARCSLCGRVLDRAEDPLSLDCGGDCWGCIGEIEAEHGYEPSLIKVRQEAEQGLRPGWREGGRRHVDP